jgi:transcriptional regulator with XRE-family HTH domain
MLNMEIVSENLKRLRKEHHLSCEDLAKVVGITRQAYNNYELKTKQITINSLMILSNFYKVSIDELVGNTCTVGRPKALDLITYEMNRDGINPTNRTIISTENDTSFLVKDVNNNMIYVFGTSSSNIPNTVMLFTYQDITYKSKVLESDNQYVFFDFDLKPIILSKKEYKEILFIGTLLFEIQPKYDFFSVK